MRGQNHLETMRRRGYAPRLVRIETDTDYRNRWADEWPALGTGEALLQIVPGERPNPAALRCVVGLAVQVDGCDSEAVALWREACLAAKASRVITAHFRKVPRYGEGPTFEAIAYTDTEGVLTWPN